MFPNLIIAGTNKAGTTSLFRYLSDHPEVCGSRVKEVRHFTRNADALAPERLAEYEDQFSSCGNSRIRLEASPDYLSGGRSVASAIRQVVPETKLIFILREPVGRLISGYLRRKSREEERLKGVDVQAYLDSLVEGIDQQAKEDILSVKYAPLIESYLDVFPADQIAVRFFDDLKDDSSAFVKDICEFLEIDPYFYTDYKFRIENRTRSIRFSALQRLAHRGNMACEPLLNRWPVIRRGLRTAYNLINETGGSELQAKTELRPVRSMLEPDLLRLRETIGNHYPGLRLPVWLRSLPTHESVK